MALAGAGLSAACRERGSTPATTDTAEAPPLGAPGRQQWTTLSFPAAGIRSEPQLAELFRPTDEADPPLLVALHGRGEAGRTLEVGARAWRDDYWIVQMHERLLAGQLESRDLYGWAEPARMEAYAQSLARHSYRGVALACPYTPALDDRSLAGSRSFAAFVTGELLPRARQVMGAQGARDRTGIDGVSMGGRLALWVGFSHPEVFASVGALQPAISVDEAETFASLAKRASSRQAQRIRLLSSEDDPFLAAVRALSKALSDAGVSHDLVVTPGPHDYAYNRGPGAVELLLWHDRALRGLPSP